HGVTVEADVSGEQTGDYVSPPTKKTVAESRQEVFKAARESARFICKSAERITAALTDPSRNVE
ncbi:MAG TPA: hypothetical protein VFW87_27080, partial [Pirellulales bacterium]|nr:hypothetical protein [Pirellulales bacterium]